MIFRKTILLALPFLLLSFSAAQALEFRKCNIRVMVSGSGLPETEVEGARFWSWARAEDASAAWVYLNKQARLCADEFFAKDRNELPSRCGANQDRLNSSRFEGRGITGLASTRGRTLLKKAICENHRRSNNRVRTIFDTREIDGLAVIIRPVGNSRACKSRRIYGPSLVKIHCRRDAADKRYEWSYKRN